MEKTDEISGEMQPVYKFSCEFEMCKENIAWKKHMRNRKTGLKLRRQKISTRYLIMEVDFCPALCIPEVPVLQAFRGISHFVWYCKAVSDLL